MTLNGLVLDEFVECKWMSLCKGNTKVKSTCYLTLYRAAVKIMVETV